MTLFLRTKPADHAADTALPSPWSAAAARRWGRKHLTKDKVINALKTAAWVFPLTILIWIYAEQEQAAEEPTVQALISLQASDPNRVVTLANATDESILVDLKGRRAKVEAVKGELAKNGPEGRVPITIPSSYPPGQIQLPIKQAVQDAPIFVSNGVNVQNVHPATISIIIDRYDTIEVPVLPPPDAKDVGTATFEPKTVRIHGPSKLQGGEGKRAG